MTAPAQIYVRIASVCLARVDRGVEGLDDEVRFDVYSLGCRGRLLASVSFLVGDRAGRPFCIFCSTTTLLLLFIGAVSF